jgi:hypothetical protein
MPKPWMWLRIASVVDGLFAVGHGLGHVRTVEGGLPGETVLSAMNTFHFNAMGSDRTPLRIPDEADQHSGMMSITIPG